MKHYIFGKIVIFSREKKSWQIEVNFGFNPVFLANATPLMLMVHLSLISVQILQAKSSKILVRNARIYRHFKATF